MNARNRFLLFERLQQHNPEPRTELIYRSEFELLIAVILSAQATDISVNKATRELFNIADTPEKMLALSEKTLRNYIKTIGLYNTKAVNILKTCQLLIERFNSQVPKTRADLESLPGVGRKTANVILNTLFGHHTIGVDTHIFRVSNRTGLAPGKNVHSVEQQLEKNVPRIFKKDAHHWLVLHGRYVCIARKPKCPECIIRDICEYRFKTVYEN